MKSIIFNNNLFSKLTKFKKIKRQNEYAKSFKKAAQDKDIKNMAEDGMEDYLKELIKYEG
jgi:hypothetical protein